jgi:hypothetical protein
VSDLVLPSGRMVSRDTFDRVKFVWDLDVAISVTRGHGRTVIEAPPGVPAELIAGCDPVDVAEILEELSLMRGPTTGGVC